MIVVMETLVVFSLRFGPDFNMDLIRKVFLFFSKIVPALKPSPLFFLISYTSIKFYGERG